MSSRYWGNLKTTDFDKIDLSNAIAIMPTGSIEQHGPHLPLCVDAKITEGILKKVMEMTPNELDVLVLPVLPIGKANEHEDYKGTLSLATNTIINYWMDIANSVVRTGLKKILILNGHGGQTNITQIVARELRVMNDVLVVPINWWSLRPKEHLYTENEYFYGVHGGAEETSVMLHLSRDLVDENEICDFTPKAYDSLKEFPLLHMAGVNYAWKAKDLNESGACGNASLSSSEDGVKIVDECSSMIIELLREMSRFNLD